MESFIALIYGPPGSGKGTQAQRIADYFGLEHLETSRLLEKIIYDSGNQDDPVVQREKKLREAGILCTPGWVTEIVKEEIFNLHRQGKGIVFSGSPRTLYEAGELIPVLENFYGKDKIFVLEIKIKLETSIFRNSHRRVCEKCRQPLVYAPENAELENCPICGGKLVTRGALDDPETIKIRLKEYQERTVPIFEYLKERGYKIIEIDGEPLPDEVTKSILEELQK